MTQPKPKVTPSGHIEVQGVSYRVMDDLAAQSCTVVRDHDGAEMGRFHLGRIDTMPRASAVFDGARDPELVLAIAQLLAVPRGALPLQ